MIQGKMGGISSFGGIFGGLLILFYNDDGVMSDTYVITLMDAASDTIRYCPQRP